MKFLLKNQIYREKKIMMEQLYSLAQHHS